MQQLNITAEVLKHLFRNCLVPDHVTLRICKAGDKIVVYTDAGVLTEFDVKEVGEIKKVQA